MTYLNLKILAQMCLKPCKVPSKMKVPLPAFWLLFGCEQDESGIQIPRFESQLDSHNLEQAS